MPSSCRIVPLQTRRSSALVSSGRSSSTWPSRAWSTSRENLCRSWLISARGKVPACPEHCMSWWTCFERTLRSGPPDSTKCNRSSANNSMWPITAASLESGAMVSPTHFISQGGMGTNGSRCSCGCCCSSCCFKEPVNIDAGADADADDAPMRPIGWLAGSCFLSFDWNRECRMTTPFIRACRRGSTSGSFWFHGSSIHCCQNQSDHPPSLSFPLESVDWLVGGWWVSGG